MLKFQTFDKIERDLCKTALLSVVKKNTDILEYLKTQNETETSKSSPNQLSFPKKPRAGSPAWLGRSPYEAEVAGSSPARPTMFLHERLS